MIIETHTPQETFDIGKKLGERAIQGEVYCLSGDLGTGKTVLAQGFADGLGIREPVSSPTFTIIQQHDGGRLPLYHFDVYRIGDISEMDEIGYEDCFYEWPELIAELLPEYAVSIRIEKDMEKGFDYRRILICRPHDSERERKGAV